MTFDPLTRPSKDEWGLAIAKAVAIRGDCRRRRIGAVVMTGDHKIIGTGYNGVAPGEVGCVAGGCPRGLKTFTEVPPNSNYDVGAGICTATHAEVNAIADAGSTAIVPGCIIYVSDEPCSWCWRLIKRFQLRCVHPSSNKDSNVVE